MEKITSAAMTVLHLELVGASGQVSVLLMHEKWAHEQGQSPNS